jgi:glucose-6-phosphate 1-dehydrogenase
MSGFETVHTKPPAEESCVIVIFGATGDLTKRKLAPALFRLMGPNGPGVAFHIVGVAMEPMSVEQFRAHLYDGVRTSKEIEDFSDADWITFAQRIYYVSGDLSSRGVYDDLAVRLAVLRAGGASANHLFYCSTPPSLAGAIVDGLGGAGLADESKGWSRIILEKPFGYDLATAQELNASVASVFEEHQTYRIDHYLGKETVQNLLVFRFGNTMFEPVWNRNYIDYVEITAAETLGVGGRAGYYEGAGALRDMVANHLLQLLTLTAMEPPVAFDADSVREQKVQVLRSIRPMTADEVAKRTVRAQYLPGVVDGAITSGYRNEPGVAEGSTTETYAAVEFHVQNWRWAGVPFYVRTGKRLARQVTEINMHFKRTPHALFANVAEDAIYPNIISLRIQPDEAVRMTFGAKRPGTVMRTATVQMDFAYETGFGVQSPTAYETLLLDAIEGDATLFTRRDEVDNEWRLISPILETWRDGPLPPVEAYEAGSAGPAAADELLARNGHGWRPLVSKPSGALKGKTGVLTWPATRMLKLPGS